MENKYYCPVCGKAMRLQVQDYPMLNRTDTLIDCTDKKCKLYMATTTPNQICNGQYVKNWQYTPVYDYMTGEKLK